jgi:hypothetical protein
MEDTQHTQDKYNTLKSLLLQEVVPMWAEKDFPKERKKVVFFFMTLSDMCTSKKAQAQ